MIMDKVIEAVMDHFGITNMDVEKVKKIIGKVEFTKQDGQDVMIVHVGKGIWVTIVQN